MQKPPNSESFNPNTDTPIKRLTGANFGWRWIAVGLIFALGLTAFANGVALTARPEVTSAPVLERVYYILGLFVVGGLDLGTPVEGPIWAQAILWIAFFGAPLLTASAVVEAVLRVLNPQQWLLRNLHDHVVIFGSGELTISYLRMLRRQNRNCRVVVVDTEFDSIREQELQQKYGVATVLGDLTLGFLRNQLRLRHAKRVLLLGENDFQAFEAATRVLESAPNLKFRVVIHCQNLRFMRTLLQTSLGRHCVIFNRYNMAGMAFVRRNLKEQFARTQGLDKVIIAGFGRFGQSVVEQLRLTQGKELAHVVIIDQDAERRMMVVEEQQQLPSNYERSVMRGDVANPDVWRRVAVKVDLEQPNTVFILGTGSGRDNLRTALWLKQKYPNAHVFARSNGQSRFASSVAGEKDITAFSINGLLEEMIPVRWTR
ncbi:MAG: NAD-binding protein [Pseudomonadota bacterium]|nr:NAD-binding protein [Pseudomonadota bacterium]